MSIVLDGTNGLSDVDGSASTPAIRGTDSNTGIFFPAADTIAFGEGGAEAMRIDSSGRVGIGTTSPSTNLTIGNGGGGNNLGVLLSLGARTNFYEAYDGTKTMIAGVDNTQDFIKIGSLNSHPVGFVTGNAERMRIDSSGNVGIGTSSPGNNRLHVRGTTSDPLIRAISVSPTGNGIYGQYNAKYDGTASDWYFGQASGGEFGFWNNTGSVSERMRITSGGDLCIGRTATFDGERIVSEKANAAGLSVNRTGGDGNLVRFYQDGTEEGNITVSGTTVSYNGGHLSRWAQTQGPKDDTLVKGTVLSNLDEMNVYTDAEGNPVPNEQLNKVKVSDVEGDVNVAGVFVNWDYDNAHNVDEINMAMTGDMIIRIAQGVVVQKGDLLMSAGDGTAKPQGDDIVRSKTVAKVTSNHVTCTYEDGSYCVPCVLMAC